MKRICVSIVVLLALISCKEDVVEVPVDLTLVEMLMADPEAVARGEALFVGTCAEFCHTVSPTETDASYLFGCSWAHGGTDQEIFDTVYSGIPDTRMVGFGSNFPEGDADLWKIIAYLRANQQVCE